jgi:hypothetical protein
MELREAWRRVVMRLGKVEVVRSRAHGYRSVVGMGLCAVLMTDMQRCSVQCAMVVGCAVRVWAIAPGGGGMGCFAKA